MSGPTFKLRLPPASLFKFPPDANPPALPPPSNIRSFAAPFGINAKLYNDALDWKVPVTIGTIYLTTAILMNKVNRSRNNVPWGFTKTAAFRYFVIAHNVFLAIFSALTFFGIIRALAHTWPGRRDLTFLGKLWPGMRTENGLVGATDALCKIHGPRNLGDAVFYNADKDVWTTTNRDIKLDVMRTPDTTDVGRLWNEGLAFWGWFFYLSKFYEVLDTFIILAKGKRSSTLQTYHHTGAMACMWAGIRFMSPPIWMFCFINSGIHALMYTYYTLAALRFRVPQSVKQTLTTMQITQFLIGIAFATLHLFVSYSVPVPTPMTKGIGQAVSAGAHAVSSAASRAPEVAAAVAPGISAVLRKYLLRAAGEEGMAQKIEPESFSRNLELLHHNHPHNKTTAFPTEYAYISCLDTTGQSFAVWLNLLYLAPLTVLFARFFYRSYLSRGTKDAKPSKPSGRLEKDAEDAANGLERKVKEAGQFVKDQVQNVAKNVNGKSGNKKSPGNKRSAGKSDKTDSRNDVSTANKQDSDSNDRSVSLSDDASETDTKQSSTASSPDKQSQQTKHDSETQNSGLADKAKQGVQVAGDGLSKAANSAKDAIGTAKLKVEESMNSSKLSDSYSIVDRKELDGSMHEKSDASSLQKSDHDEAPTSSQPTKLKQTESKESKTSKASGKGGGHDDKSGQAKAQEGKADKPSKQSDNAAAKSAENKSSSPKKTTDANPGTSKSKDGQAKSTQSSKSGGATDVKPDLSARSVSPEDRSRSASPSKTSAKSKLPQPKNRASGSPTKKVTTPAKITTSMAAHSGTALEDKDTSAIGNA